MNPRVNQMATKEQEIALWLLDLSVHLRDLSKEAQAEIKARGKSEVYWEMIRQGNAEWMQTYQKYNLIQELLIFYYQDTNFFSPHLRKQEFVANHTSILDSYNIIEESLYDSSLSTIERISLLGIDKLKKAKGVMIVTPELLAVAPEDEFDSEYLANQHAQGEDITLYAEEVSRRVQKYMSENFSIKVSDNYYIAKIPDVYIYCLSFWSIEMKELFEYVLNLALHNLKKGTEQFAEMNREKGIIVQVLDNQQITCLKFPAKYIEISEVTKSNIENTIQYFIERNEDPKGKYQYFFVSLETFRHLFYYLIDTTQGTRSNRVEIFLENIRTSGIYDAYKQAQENNKTLTLVWITGITEIESLSSRQSGREEFLPSIMRKCISLLLLLKIEYGIEVYFPRATSITEEYFNYAGYIENPMKFMMIYEQIEYLKKYPKIYLLRREGSLSIFLQSSNNKVTSAFISIDGFKVDADNLSKVQRIRKKEKAGNFNLKDIEVKSLLFSEDIRRNNISIEELNSDLEDILENNQEQILKLLTAIESNLDGSIYLDIFNTFEMIEGGKKYYLVVDKFDFNIVGQIIPHSKKLSPIEIIIKKTDLYESIPLSDIDPLEDDFLQQYQDNIVKKGLASIYENKGKIKGRKNPAYHDVVSLACRVLEEDDLKDSVLLIDILKAEYMPIRLVDIKEEVFNLDIKKIRKSPSNSIIGFSKNNLQVCSEMLQYNELEDNITQEGNIAYAKVPNSDRHSELYSTATARLNKRAFHT